MENDKEIKSSMDEVTGKEELTNYLDAEVEKWRKLWRFILIETEAIQNIQLIIQFFARDNRNTHTLTRNVFTILWKKRTIQQ
jgi:lipid-A-disaccharide synthase-like uncharacterized protein